MIQLRRVRVPVLVGLALMLPGLLGATAVGILDIAGVGGVRVSGSTINFSPYGPLGTGDFAVTSVFGDFTALSLLSTGLIADLSDPPSTAGPDLATPVDPFVTVPIPGSGRFVFNLEQIFLGSGPPCTIPPGTGFSCSPSELAPNTPFLLTQTSSGVGFSFSVRGTVFDTSDSTSSPYVGLFTGNLSGATVSSVLASLTGAPGYVESSWSAEFVSGIPEPGTLALIGGGLLVLGVARRRKTRT